MPDRSKPSEEIDAEYVDIDIVMVAFPVSFHVSSTGTLETTFLVDENLVPIKIERIPGI